MELILYVFSFGIASIVGYQARKSYIPIIALLGILALPMDLIRYVFHKCVEYMVVDFYVTKAEDILEGVTDWFGEIRADFGGNADTECSDVGDWFEMDD